MGAARQLVCEKSLNMDAPADSRARVVKLVLIVSGGLMAGMVLYFSWTPDPAMSRVDWLPTGVGAWADRHVRMRTGVALVPLGVLLGLWLAFSHGKLKHWIISGSYLLLLVSVAELGQLMTPRRVFDWMDIIWGGIGIVCGMGLIASARFVWTIRLVYLRKSARIPVLRERSGMGNAFESAQVPQLMKNPKD